MTNWEKFKEVFGIPQGTPIDVNERICEILDCGLMEKCTECPFSELDMDSPFFWDDEYVEREEKE